MGWGDVGWSVTWQGQGASNRVAGPAEERERCCKSPGDLIKLQVLMQ